MQRNAQGANVRPKKARQQNPRRGHGNSQQDTLMRRPNGPLVPPPQAPMTTEYQERFLPPSCYRTYITTSRGKDPYHPLRGTNTDIGTFRSIFIAQNSRRTLPQPPQPSEPPKDYRRRSSSATRHPARAVANRTPPKHDFVTVYQSDFQPWVVNMRQPLRFKDNFNIKYGMLALDHSPEEDERPTTTTGVPQQEEAKPAKSTTSYRHDYVFRPVRPREGRVMFSATHGQVLPPEPAAAPKGALEESSDFLDKFQSWSLETNFYGQTKEPSSPEDHRFVQTIHSLPSVQTGKNSVEPVLGTTMEEDFRAWSAPQRTKQESGTAGPSRRTNPSSDAAKKLQVPVENGGTRTVWSSCVDTGADGCRVRCSVSRRN